MFFGIIGFFVLIFSTMKDTGVSVGGIIFGVVLILLGLMAIDVHDENVRIRSAKRQYWLKQYDELEAEKRKKGSYDRV